MAMAQRRQRRDRWKPSDTVYVMTYRGDEPDVSRVIDDVRQFVDEFNAYARLMGWSVRLRLDISKTNPDTGEEVRIHIHCHLKANPGWTAFKWIRAYWYKRHGIVKLDKRKKLVNPEGYAVYCNKQAIRTTILTCNCQQQLPPQPPVPVPAPMIIGKFSKIIHSVDCMVSNSVTGINSNSTSYDPVYDVDICYQSEEPPYLDSFPADVVAEIAAGEETGQEVIVVDKLVDCKENMPGSNDQGSHDTGNGIELLDAPEYLIPENYDAIVKIESPSPGNRGGSGKSRKVGCFHARYNPAVSDYVVDMPGLLRYMAANIAPSTPIRAGPQRALAVIVNTAA